MIDFIDIHRRRVIVQYKGLPFQLQRRNFTKLPGDFIIHSRISGVHLSLVVDSTELISPMIEEVYKIHIDAERCNTRELGMVEAVNQVKNQTFEPGQYEVEHVSTNDKIHLFQVKKTYPTEIT